jgi:hypothetical protein
MIDDNDDSDARPRSEIRARRVARREGDRVEGSVPRPPAAPRPPTETTNRRSGPPPLPATWPARLAAALFVLLMAGVAAVLLLAQLGDYATLGGERARMSAAAGGGQGSSGRLFSRASLADYDGVRRPEIYVSILGEVFDVSSKPQFYGPPALRAKEEAGAAAAGSGGSSGNGVEEEDKQEEPELGYRVFVGRDGTRAYSTGEFTLSKATDSVVGEPQQQGEEEATAVAAGERRRQQQHQQQPPLEPEQLLELTEWLDFYRRTYPHKGILAGGAFYDAQGRPRQALARVRQGAAKGEEVRAERERRRRAAAASRPACEARWSAEDGAEVWCADGKTFPRRVRRADERVGEEDDGGSGGGGGSDSSPGAERRRRQQRERGGAGAWRCVCFEEVGWSDLRQVYEGCAPDATRCKIGGGDGV